VHKVNSKISIINGELPMAKKSDRVRRREIKKAEKAIRNKSRIIPKRDTKSSLDRKETFPESHVITLDDLTNPDFDK
jgi:hypothetical protein